MKQISWPCSRLHSIDKAALYDEEGADRSTHHGLWGSVTVSREAFELLRLKDRAMDNTKEGITIADCRQARPVLRNPLPVARSVKQMQIMQKPAVLGMTREVGRPERQVL